MGTLQVDLQALKDLPYPAEFKLRSSLVLAGDPAYLAFKQRVLQGQIRRALGVVWHGLAHGAGLLVVGGRQHEGAATPAGTALNFVLSVMNGAKLTATDVAAHFSPSFLAAIPAGDLQVVAAQLAGARRRWPAATVRARRRAAGLGSLAIR